MWSEQFTSKETWDIYMWLLHDRKNWAQVQKMGDVRLADSLGLRKPNGAELAWAIVDRCLRAQGYKGGLPGKPALFDDPNWNWYRVDYDELESALRLAVQD